MIKKKNKIINFFKDFLKFDKLPQQNKDLFIMDVTKEVHFQDFQSLLDVNSKKRNSEEIIEI